MKRYTQMLAILLVSITSMSAWAQKKEEGIDKIIFGYYKVGQIDLKEYVVSKSGEVLFTSRMDKQYTHIGHLPKSDVKELFLYCDSKQWNDFIKFNPGKDYRYMRFYKGKEYVEMMWAENGADAQMHDAFDRLLKIVEDFKLPEPEMAVKH